ncbi:MAG: Hydrolase, alpha/beta fold family, partial [uncultured Rubrobacteraceae bacterium]
DGDRSRAGRRSHAARVRHGRGRCGRPARRLLAPRHAEHRRAPRAPLRNRGPARHSLGVVRPARVRRIYPPPGPGLGVGGRLRLWCRRRTWHRPVRGHRPLRWRLARPGVRRSAARACPGRGQRVRAGPVRRRGTRLVRGHGPLWRGVAARRGRRTRGEGEVRGFGRRAGPRVHTGGLGRDLRRMVLAWGRRRPGRGGRAGRAHRRRPRLRRPVGGRPRADNRADPPVARRPGSRRTPLARRVARAPLPLGGAVAAPGRRAHLGPRPERGGLGVAAGARRPGL